MVSSIAQFQIKPIGAELHLFGIDISFNNSALFMIIATILVSAFLTQSVKSSYTIPNRIQSLAEMTYEFTTKIVSENVGIEGMAYFPLIFSLFMFILAGNLLGILPYAYTFTSQIIVTFAISIAIFLGITVIAIIKHGTKFFRFFLPSGTPVYMAPLLIPIEILSYLSRPISLSVRLFANMVAGHTMMKVFGGFVISLGAAGFVPLLFLVALTAFEVLVAVLQAYVFTIITCIYLSDALYLH
ncbi:ATP synthase F0, A subunit [Candidatus Endolissoclinum faulkneri L5]|uniref:ATP synthase subunit a n=1 Tax=Candidatus Endolissoclinum faulkneri L5 TaxID=1401328 RepID=V9TVQ0_9PROT|nr:F0F1 ATP synthase subunit A [Candidatus Endolissoclinum faulkneri]AHC73415.1 ATP synthase F0, A subunit [Candidatus Endolissoclinum faulkneri L5]